MGAGIFIKNTCFGYPEIDGYALPDIHAQAGHSRQPDGFVVFAGVVGALVTTAAVPFFWQPVTAFDWLPFVFAEIEGGIGYARYLREGHTLLLVKRQRQ